MKTRFNQLMAGLMVLAGVLEARQPARARHAMVIAQQPAEEAGLAVLKKGGNAIDAAIAVGFALNVTYPYAGAMGGGGYMLIRFADGRTTFIDFRETAPAGATRDMYIGPDGKATRESLEGWRSSGVPGTVRGFGMAHAKYGKLKWAEDVAPAIELAAKGFPVSYALAEQLKGDQKLAKDGESKRIYLKDGAYYGPGETFRNPDLALTLERISKNGPSEFYEGQTAQLLAGAMAKNGGLITLNDLRNYAVAERAPVTGKYHGDTIISAPPSSSGGVGLLQMLAMLEGSGYEKTGFGSAASLHYLAETMRRFYADRNQYLGDPDFVKNPLAGLLDPAYIARRRASIDPEHATPSGELGPGKPAGAESAETTHFDVVDEEGNAVAVTFTLNGGHGNGITVPGAGFLLNNEMDDFAAKPGEPNGFGLVQGEANAIQPGKRPLSSMTPTIVERDGKLFMVLGSPGGSHITTAVLQVYLNVVDFGMNVQDAVDAPRIHHQWKPDRLFVEKGISPDTVALLRARGHDVTLEPGLIPACVEAIVSEGGWLEGGADGRRTGRAAGY
jgi:gamma-glutamyltranspeptidase/glutathione hydrolase